MLTPHSRKEGEMARFTSFTEAKLRQEDALREAAQRRWAQQVRRQQKQTRSINRAFRLVTR